MITEFQIVMTVKVEDLHGNLTTTDEVLEATRRELDKGGDVITLTEIAVSRFKGTCNKCGRKVFNANEMQRQDQAGHFVCKTCS